MCLEYASIVFSTNPFYRFICHKIMDMVQIAIVAGATLVAILASLYGFALSQVAFLKKNWVQYRCNPIYMPMAGMVGQDVFSNFTKCTMKGFQDYAGFVMDPVMAEFSTVSDTIGEIGSTMNSMRHMMGGVRGGFLGIIGSVFGKIQNLMSQFQYIIIRMRTLLGRVIAMMYSFIYIFYAGAESGQSLVNGPVGKVMSFLCFDGDTIVSTPEGPKTMREIRIGDSISGSLVTSLYRITGTNAALYMLEGVYVTGSHKVKHGDTFIRVDEHPDAELSMKEVDVLYCLNTSDHRIRIGSFEFLDFVENTQQEFLDFRNKYIQMIYNGTVQTPSYRETTGLISNTQVSLKDNRTKSISDVCIGDILDNGEVVLGVVCHLGRHTYQYSEIIPGVIGTPSTWVYRNAHIERAGAMALNALQNTHEQPKFVYQLITSSSMYPVVGSNGKRVMILDELETTDDFYHSLKDSIITSGSFRGKRIVV
jgi:hypothetical protein